jgi:hypothetical protein
MHNMVSSSATSFLSWLLFSLSSGVTSQGDSCDDVDLNAVSEAAGVHLLQTRHVYLPGPFQRDIPPAQDGCWDGDYFAMPDGDSWKDVDNNNHFENQVDGVDVVGTNARQTSYCSRSKKILDDLQQVLQVQFEKSQWSVKPKRILSVGCSIGYEARELRGRYPHAEIVGFDINAPVVEMANAKWDPALKMRFTSNKSDVPANYFDLITVNNVLVEPTEKEDFLSFLAEWRSWLQEDGGILEMEVFKSFRITGSSFTDVMQNVSKPSYIHQIAVPRYDYNDPGHGNILWLERSQRN